MKKILYFVAIAMTVLVASCKKESVNAPEIGENQFMAIIDNGVAQNAPVVGDGMTTKTRIDGLNVYWNAGDEITINGTTCTTSMSGNQVLFTASAAITAQTTGSAYEAYYGCTAGNMPATQVFDIDDTKFPMYAASSDKNLVFHNICGLLKVTIPAGITATSVEVSADQQLNGSFTINTTDASKPYAQMNGTTVTDDMKKITVNPKAEETFAAGSDVYVAIPQGEYTNMTLKIYGTTETISRTQNSFTVDVNKIYGVSIAPVVVPEDAFCFTVGANGSTITLSATASAPAVSLEYFVEDTWGWNTYTVGNNIVVPANKKLYFRGGTNNNNKFATSVTDAKKGTVTYYNYFTSTENVTVSGNIMYLLRGDGLKSSFALSNESAFSNLFNGMTTLTDASGLILPNSTVTFCYKEMFKDCSNLTAAPELIASTLSDECYAGLFMNCSSLGIVVMLATNTATAYDGIKTTLYDAMVSDMVKMLSGAGSESAVQTKVIYVYNSEIKDGLLQANNVDDMDFMRMNTNNWAFKVNPQP